MRPQRRPSSRIRRFLLIVQFKPSEMVNKPFNAAIQPTQKCKEQRLEF
jgi:hypothetical protein